MSTSPPVEDVTCGNEMTGGKVCGRPKNHKGFCGSALPPAGDSQRKCKCDLRTRLVGDGCAVCNPDKAAEYAK